MTDSYRLPKALSTEATSLHVERPPALDSHEAVEHPRLLSLCLQARPGMDTGSGSRDETNPMEAP